jgi:hypothetical protein
MISSTRPMIASMPSIRRPGVPMIHSSARKMTSSMNVVPRSSPIITSRAMMATPGSSGMSNCRQSSS